MYLKPHYVELKDSLLVINRAFKSDRVLINAIESIELQTSPFSSSYIRLKESRKSVDFDYYMVRDDDFKQMTESLEVLVK